MGAEERREVRDGSDMKDTKTRPISKGAISNGAETRMGDHRVIDAFAGDVPVTTRHSGASTRSEEGGGGGGAYSEQGIEKLDRRGGGSNTHRVPQKV